MKRKARERAARSSKTDARFTAKIIARTMKAARAEMRMRNGRRGHDQKRDQKRKVEREQGKQLKYCFPKNEICEIVSVPKTCLFLRQNRSNYGKYSLVQWSLPVVFLLWTCVDFGYSFGLLAQYKAFHHCRSVELKVFTWNGRK